MEQWCWVNFQCRCILLIWITVGQGPTALAVCAGRTVWTFFSRLSFLFSFSWGWSGGAMVLGKLPVPGHPTNLD